MVCGKRADTATKKTETYTTLNANPEQARSPQISKRNECLNDCRFTAPPRGSSQAEKSNGHKRKLAHMQLYKNDSSCLASPM